MNKGELISAVADRTGQTKRMTEGFIDAFAATVVTAVATGEKVNIVGFGNFERKHRSARIGRNPRTGEAIQIGAKNFPSFSPGKAFKENVA